MYQWANFGLKVGLTRPNSITLSSLRKCYNEDLECGTYFERFNLTTNKYEEINGLKYFK